MENKEPLISEQMEKLKINENQTEPQPGTSAAPQTVKTSNKATGGGGADTSHGLVFHLNIAMLMLFSLKEKSQSELDFQYKIWLEKEGYGKFDDIVLQYNKSDGKRTQLCVQCKHGEEKITDGKKSVKSISAEEFLSNKSKIKGFNLVEYITSFGEMEGTNIDSDTYLVLLSNRIYVNDKDLKYPVFQREEIAELSQLISLNIFEKTCFKIKFSDELGDFLLKQITSKSKTDINVSVNTIKEFCDKFIYICDERNLEDTLNQKLALQCRHNRENMKNLKSRLYYLVSQMYQHKMDPTKNDIINEFNGRNIYFQIPNACPKFTGRVKELQRMNDALDNEKSRLIFDLLITGITGMGKTQLVRKYIDDFKQNYKNIIWINAENRDALENSFVELAISCNLIKKDCKDEISIIIEAIYSYFSEHTLFIFDNTSKVLLSKNEKKEYTYLPHFDQYNNNKFLIISQDQKWTTNHPPVRVDKFSVDDALVYIDASIECCKDDQLILASTFQYWPLALCLAVSYVKLESENELGRKTCSDVINTLQVQFMDKHLPENYEMEPYTDSLHSLWLLIQDKLQMEDKITLEILYILAFSNPDHFPLDLIKINDVSEGQVTKAAETLQQNSIVTLGDCKISIHRTLQLVIKNYITSSIDLYEPTLLNCTLCFRKYLVSMKIQECMKPLGNIHMVTFLIYICESNIDPLKYIKMANLLLNKLNESQDLRNYCAPDGIFDKILRVAKEKLGDTHEDTLCTLMRTARMLRSTGKLIDALNTFNELIEKYNEMFGAMHLDTLQCWHSKALILHDIGKYEESLSIFNHVIEAKREVLGEKDQGLLSSMNCKSLLLEDMGKYDEALDIYNQVIEIERREVLGGNNLSLLMTMSNKALVLNKLGKYDEALNIYNHVIEIEREMLGDNNPSFLTKLNNKALVLFNMGKNKESLNIFNHVIKMRREILGDNHPDFLASMNNKALVLMHLGKYDEALNIYNQVIEIERKLVGDNNPSLLTKLNNKALVLKQLGKYEEALNIYNHVIEIRREMLGDNNPSLLIVMNNKASVLKELRKYEEALNIYNHIMEIQREMLGDKHPSLLTVMSNKALVLENMGKYEESLSILDRVIEMGTEVLGVNHPSLLTIMNNKASVLNKFGKYEDALDIYIRVVESERKILGDKNPSFLITMSNQASVLSKLGKYEEALNVYNHLIEMRTQVLGEKHPNTIESKNNRDKVLNSMQKNA